MRRDGVETRSGGGFVGPRSAATTETAVCLPCSGRWRGVTNVRLDGKDSGSCCYWKRNMAFCPCVPVFRPNCAVCSLEEVAWRRETVVVVGWQGACR